jgi:hypothetical protein
MNRKKAMDAYVRLYSMFGGYTAGVKEIEAMLNDLSDKEFKAYMERVRDGEEVIPYIDNIMSGSKVTLEGNLAIADKLGHNFYERLWIEDPVTGDVNLTPQTYLIVDLPFRRQQQHLLEKIGIPDSNNHIDEMTGQVTGPSKGSRVSYPEMQIGLYAKGLKASTMELFTIRGGNTDAYAAMERDAYNGEFPSINAFYDSSTTTKSNVTLSILFKGAMLDNNILRK